jgi:segregation and condensation protein B
MTQTEVQSENGASENGAGARIAPSGETLKNVLESLIFVSSRPVTPKKLARAARATIAEVQPLLDELVADYQHRGVHLYYVAGGYQFRSARESADFVKTLVAPKPIRLTRAQLETLAIVAYRQPLTRPEVDDVRGVDSGSSLKMLTDRGLVKILGRKDEPGRPLVYGTTPGFLEFFGLSGLKDLPTLHVAAAELAAAEAMEQAEQELLAEEEAAIAAAAAEASAEDEDDELEEDEDDEDDEDGEA